MSGNHLKPKTPETTRRYEWELLKALAIISMILCNPVIRLGIHNPGYETAFPYFLGQTIFGNYLGVDHALVLAVGFSIIYMQKNAPKDLMRLGVKLYLLGYLLNFLRYGMYNLIESVSNGEFRSDTLQALFGMDILHIAGLALIFTGILKKLKLREVHMLAIAGVLSAISAPLPLINTGNYAANWFIGHFVSTNSDACGFPLFNWYVFVAVGMLLASILRKTKDPDRFYKRLLIVSCCVMVVYITLTFCFGEFFLCRDRDYYALSLPEAAGLLSIDLSLLSVFYFLLKRVPASKLRVFLDMGSNMIPIYFIHWIILGFVDSIFCYLLDITFPWPVIYLIGVVLIVLSSWIAKLWAGRKRRAKAK